MTRFKLAVPLRVSMAASVGVSGDPAWLPAWLSGVAINEATEIASTAIRAGSGTRLAYSGLANRDTLLVLACCGGHNDSSDNGVDSLDLTADAPSWTNRLAPFGSPVVDVAYYQTTPTVEPTSRHTYNYTHWSAVRNRLMLYGTAVPYGSGSAGTAVSNSLNLDTWAWDAAGTVADTGSCLVQDADGYAYAIRSFFAVNEYDPVANTVTELSAFSDEVTRPIAHDSTRNVFFQCSYGNGAGGGTGRRLFRYGARFASQAAITFNSSSAATALEADTAVDCTMFYVSALDAYFYWTGTALYKITPNAGTVWDVEIVTITGATLPAPSHAHTRACWVPSLGGMAYLPSQTSNLYFVRLV